MPVGVDVPAASSPNHRDPKQLMLQALRPASSKLRDSFQSLQKSTLLPLKPSWGLLHGADAAAEQKEQPPAEAGCHVEQMFSEVPCICCSVGWFRVDNCKMLQVSALEGPSGQGQSEGAQRAGKGPSGDLPDLCGCEWVPFSFGGVGMRRSS